MASHDVMASYEWSLVCVGLGILLLYFPQFKNLGQQEACGARICLACTGLKFPGLVLDWTELYQEWWKGHWSLSQSGFFGADDAISDLINLSSKTERFPWRYRYQTLRGVTSVHYLHSLIYFIGAVAILWPVYPWLCPNDCCNGQCTILAAGQFFL